MAEDLKANLASYKLQLQQVESSLAEDPENEDLIKLQKDLQEVIDLTLEMMGTKPGTAGNDESTTEMSSNANNDVAVQHDWKPGDACMAIWSEDGQHYDATIDEILEDGTCTVTFASYGNTDVTNLSLLKVIDPDHKRPGEDGDDGPEAKKQKSKRDLLAAQREYKKKKSQKKAQRFKQLEEERETEKNKWLDFNAKTFSKTNKGKVKKSIFATPDTIKGRVGVGTCGVGGKPMTNFPPHTKWQK
ncbi:hypothetical protein CHS0354_003257 [Potamilus streckersoni]|uniref:Survival of motor neuron-related-splicing factor 30 n=1 Tax=Potamilus streckersoni TaxID=2493646 RepID=A0AAE0SV20_9BIVA|nr:hypothetical protein CHS0354_003257 [Potamilus streckersoni]